MRWTLRATFLFATLTTTSPRADWPPPEGADLTLVANQPNDPGYGGEWNLWSFIPPENVGLVSDYEIMIGSGIHADRAWQRTIGSRRVVIAVLDSGIKWREDDLVNKFYLNAGELPPPGCDNADGVFNVQDYTTATGHELPTVDRLCDPAVTDMNGNGLVDPQDLIMIFSDGVDDDMNGYIDDISGWDAFHNDNDPNDDTEFGHGTGEARDSAAETNNQRGGTGVCPECSLLMVRAGDSFVCDAAEFAAAVYFAVDSGASVVQEALGSINNPKVARDALDYASAQGVAVVASAADEDSFHHNMPGTNNHTIYVHANVFDSQSRDTATTFLAFNNCTNYGAQLLLSTPGTGCSSEATGITSGIVGLIYSAALQVNLSPPLHGEEVKQLLLTTVDDIYDPDSATDPDRYPTLVGWEQRFGYGRSNARNAVDAVLDGRIPPIVDITAPGWFAVLYPEKTPMVAIHGSIRYRDAIFDSYDYTIEWAPGVEPEDAAYTTIAEGTNETAQQADATLAMWDISQLTIQNPPMPEPDVDVNNNMVTVRIRVTTHDSAGVTPDTKGEIRRAYHIVRDPSLVAGYPIDLGAGAEASPKISDLDGDGKMELIQLAADGWVHVFDAAGAERTGWPQGLNLLSATANHLDSPAAVSGALDSDARSSSIATPAIGDLDGSGGADRDIVAASLDGSVYAWTAAGQLLPGFPVAVDPTIGLAGTEQDLIDVGIFAAPVLADLDGNGDLEIVVAAYDGYLYAWNHDGTAAAGFPVLLKDTRRADAQQRRMVATPAAGDIDGDGLPEIVAATTEDYANSGRLYAVNGDGTIVTGWPISIRSVRILPLVGEGLPNSPCLADVDHDGDVEIAIAGIVVPPAIFQGDGTLIGSINNSEYGANTTSDDVPTVSMVANGAFGDVDNDGQPDIIWAGAGFGAANAFAGSGRREDFDHVIGVWRTALVDGSYPYLPGFPQRVDDWQFFENPAVADVDSDGLPEVINGSGGYYLRAWNHRGEQPAGWPKQTGQWIVASPAVGDLDGDGTLEVAVGSREGFLYAWHTEGSTEGRVDWASFHHDDHNTGNFAIPLPFGTAAGPKSGGCGCATAATNGAPAAALLLLAASAVLLRRRIRRRRPT